MAKSSGKSGHDDRRFARRRALQALYQWCMTGQAADDIFRQFVAEQDMSRVDVDYFKMMLSAVVDQHEAIDLRLSENLDRDMSQIDPLEQAVLRLGAYELLHRLELPYRVVLDEAIDLAKNFGSEQSPVYVNGVLDHCAREWRSEEYGSR
jgi:N utilization substance protein B